MQTIKDQQQDAISKFGISWGFWTTFAWIETRDIEVGIHIEVSRMGKPAEILPAVTRDRAMSGVHLRLCHDEDGRTTHSAKNCPLWKQTWKRLQTEALQGKIETLGLKGSEDIPSKISPAAWQVARMSTDPTMLKIESTYWSNVKFNAFHIMRIFKPLTRDRREQISEHELRKWLVSILPQKPPVTHLVRMASIQFPENCPPSKGRMSALCKELNYLRPAGRPRKTC